MTTTPDHLANMLIPAGATSVCSWDDPDLISDPTALRYFRGRQWVVDRSDDKYNGDLTVEIWGTQSREGAVERHVDVLDEEHRQIETLSSAAHVRKLGEALIAAATEIDEMNSRDEGVDR